MSQPLTDSTINYIENEILNYMRQKRSFTSVDIANQAKDIGLWARNRQVAEWLRSNAISVAHRFGHLYNQTLIHVHSTEDGPTLAYLYHDMEVNEDDYRDRVQNPRSVNTAAQLNNRRKLDLVHGSKPVLNTRASTPVRATVTTTITTAASRSGHDGWKNQVRLSSGQFGPNR